MSGKSNAPSKQVSHCVVENSYRGEKCQSLSDRPAYEYDQRQCDTGLFTARSGDAGDTGIEASAEQPPSDCSGDAADASGIPVGADSPIHEFGTDLPGHDGGGGVGLQHAASPVLFTNPSDAQSDVISSDNSGVVAHESVIHNNVDCVDSCLSDGWSELR